MQPLKSNQDIAVVERGSEVLRQLHAHALRFPEQVQAVGSAAEECEREVEQEKEVEQQMERELRYNRTVPRCETDWKSWEKALLCETSQDFQLFADEAQVQFKSSSSAASLPPRKVSRHVCCAFEQRLS
jgi:hypothetical protein